MFSSKSKTERTAAQAWEYLTAAMAAAGDTAKDTGDKIAGKAGDQGHKLAGKGHELAGKGYELAGKGQKLAGKASGKAGKKADLAWGRANAAAAALAGRKPSQPWGLIIGVGLLGVAVGWAAATSARAALERQAEQEELELAENAVVVTPTYDN